MFVVKPIFYCTNVVNRTKWTQSDVGFVCGF